MTRSFIRKYVMYCLAVLFFSCQNKAEKVDQHVIEDDVVKIDTTNQKSVNDVKQYANDRFRDVVVEMTSVGKFRVQGKGQLFEGTLNWVVEDGHETLKEGFATTDAGAPEWGSFDFTIEVAKKRANSTLTLVLFEESAEDGSPKYELPIFLY